MEEKTSFQFLLEISKEKTYRLLFPNQREGMAIIYLYEKIINGTFIDRTFKEEDIHIAIQSTQPIAGEHSRYPREHYNTLIADLQEYFIRYDDEKQVYFFKEYAYEFCKHAHDTLRATFDPTQIEKICFTLRERLESKTQEEDIIEWFKNDFGIFKPTIKRQVDFLDIQIDHSVAELRKNNKLSLQEGEIISTLKAIDERFNEIRKQNKELEIAFREIESIKRILRQHEDKFDNDQIKELAYESFLFFQEIRRTLSLVDRRLDRIQPKIKQLFSNLNKPLFNSRVEKFLLYLLDFSSLSSDNAKRILLPEGIPPFSTRSYMPQFIIFERKANLFPTKPKKRLQIKENDSLKAFAFARFTQKIGQQSEIDNWITKIRNDVDKTSDVRFSPYFFEILNSGDKSSLDLAINVACRALRQFEQQKYFISIYPEIRITDGHNKTSLWEMRIKKKT